jgi:hypothetical protein
MRHQVISEMGVSRGEALGEERVKTVAWRLHADVVSVREPRSHDWMGTALQGDRKDPSRRLPGSDQVAREVADADGATAIPPSAPGRGAPDRIPATWPIPHVWRDHDGLVDRPVSEPERI